VAVSEPSQIRPAQFADDQWYPATSARLQQTIRSLLDGAADRGLGRPLGLVVPHAGLRFSGGIAAEAYRQAMGQSYEHVAVISPLHRHYFGPYAVTLYRHYSTPLGLIPVAEEMLAGLEQLLPISRSQRDDEHSLEIQLPFLQVAIAEFSLLPVMMGEQGLDACRALTGALASLLRDKQALVVASSDLSHFHHYDAAKRLDAVIAEHIEQYDAEGLAQALALGQAEACGGGPIVTAMLACHELGARSATVLAQANSGDVWIDRSSVVGYLAAAMY